MRRVKSFMHRVKSPIGRVLTLIGRVRNSIGRVESSIYRVLTLRVVDLFRCDFGGGAKPSVKSLTLGGQFEAFSYATTLTFRLPIGARIATLQF